jgi:hypothetical protein
VDAAKTSIIAPKVNKSVLRLINKAEESGKIDPSPWTIYSHAYDVPESKMGKATMKTDKGYPLGEGPKETEGGAKLWVSGPLGGPAAKEQKKEEAKVSFASAPGMGSKKMAEKSLEMLSDMEKSTEKAAMGSVKIGEKGPVQESSGKPLGEAYKEATLKKPPTVLPMEAKPAQKAVSAGTGSNPGGVVGGGAMAAPGGGVKSMDKALSSMSIPRISRGRAEALDIQRSGSNVLTRANSRFAKDIHTGPLTGELVEELSEDAAHRTRYAPVYKACGSCGRRYMAKSADAGCPSCVIHKARRCPKCGREMNKGRDGTLGCSVCD